MQKYKYFAKCFFTNFFIIGFTNNRLKLNGKLTIICKIYNKTFTTYL